MTGCDCLSAVWLVSWQNNGVLKQHLGHTVPNTQGRWAGRSLKNTNRTPSNVALSFFLVFLSPSQLHSLRLYSLPCNKKQVCFYLSWIVKTWCRRWSGLTFAAGPEQMEEPAQECQLWYCEEERGKGEDRADHVQQQQKVQDLQGDARGEVRENTPDRVLLIVQGYCII